MKKKLLRPVFELESPMSFSTVITSTLSMQKEYNTYNKSKKVKLVDHNRGWPKDFLCNIYYTVV